MAKMKKCKIYTTKEGRSYFVHLKKRYYFDEFSSHNGMSLVEYHLDFKIADIEYGIEDYAILEHI